MNVLEKLEAGIPDGEGLAYAIILLQEGAEEIERLRKIIEHWQTNPDFCRT